jgi:hypothetical protein
MKKLTSKEMKNAAGGTGTIDKDLKPQPDQVVSLGKLG